MAVTRNDVARAAGVSSAVVSYVLNDGPRPVSADARRRVLEAIDRLGYRRDRVARSLRRGTTDSIGLVLPDITLTYFGVTTQRITEIADARGLSVVVATSHGSIESERKHIQDLADRRVDGIILMSVDPVVPLEWAEALGVPIVMVDRPEVATAGMRAATTHLIAHGRTRLARISGREGLSTTERRDAGWWQALGEHDIDGNDRAVIRADPTERGGYMAAKQLLRAFRPDALVADSGPQAIGAVRALADSGMAVPHDVHLVTFELGDSGNYTTPRISSVDSPIDRIAALAIDRVMESAGEPGIQQMTDYRFSVNPRESCGPHIPTDAYEGAASA